MHSTSTSPCPQCGEPVPRNALAGLCPRCLMDMNLAPNTNVGENTDTNPPSTRPRPAMPSPQEMAPFFPELEILECLGQGGMGIVYKARQKKLDRFVALKILPRDVGQAPGFAERFAREARALATLNHPGIVTLYEFGQVEDATTDPPVPLYFFLMEYVDGANLRQIMSAGRVSPREALAIVPQICDALQFAHDQGIVHRDIKPENILIDRRGNVKVADFGLAKIVIASGEDLLKHSKTSPTVSEDITEAGKVMGTPRYMSPEQTETPATVDHRTDIYALGVVFYQMLTGEFPGMPLMPPSARVQIDVRLDEIVLRALERDPGRRYAQASMLKTQVEMVATPIDEEGDHTPGLPPLSRTGLAGLIWIGLFFLNWVVSYTPSGWALTGLFRDGPLQVAAELLVFLPLTILGFAAIAGGSAMGVLALRRIRQTRGAVGHLGIALFDLLFFPVVLINLWFMWLAHQLIEQIDSARVILVILFVIGGVALNGVVIRMAIQWAKEFVRSPAPPAREPETATWSQVIRMSVLRLLLVTAINLLLFETLQQVSVAWKESTGELWHMGLAAAALGGVIWATWPGYRFRRSWPFWAGGAMASAFALHALVYFYSWHLRPNLGLYRESEWVSQHPGFQKTLRENIEDNLWKATEGSESSGAREVPHAPFIGRLPRGSVELVALSRHPSTGAAWWAPDGSALQDVRYVTEASGGGDTDKFNWFSLVVRLGDLPADSSPPSLVLGPRNTWATGEVLTNEDRAEHGLIMIATKQPSSATEATVRIGIASGAWETVAKAKAGSIPPLAQATDFGVVAFLPPVDTDKGIRFTATHTMRNVQLCLVAIEPDGTTYQGSEMDQMISEELGNTTTTFVGLSINQAIHRHVEFHLQLRPYQWVEFNNVSLSPGHTTRVAVAHAE